MHNIFVNVKYEYEKKRKTKTKWLNTFYINPTPMNLYPDVSLKMQVAKWKAEWLGFTVYLNWQIICTK